jgi:hypothetical protein
MIAAYPDLDFANEVTTAYYRQLSPDFPMSSRPIHIDSACVVLDGVKVIWSYYDWELNGEILSYGMRFTIIIDNNFWLEQQTAIISANAKELQLAA